MGAETVGARGVEATLVWFGCGISVDDNGRWFDEEDDEVCGVSTMLAVWLVAGFWGVLGGLIVAFFCG